MDSRVFSLNALLLTDGQVGYEVFPPDSLRCRAEIDEYALFVTCYDRYDSFPEPESLVDNELVCNDCWYVRGRCIDDVVHIRATCLQPITEFDLFQQDLPASRVLEIAAYAAIANDKQVPTPYVTPESLSERYEDD